MTYEYNAHGITRDGIKIYNNNKNKLGNITRAVMQTINGESVFSLYDENQDCLRIISGVNSGYNGEGPHGTLTILRDSGFSIEDDYIFRHDSFDLSK